MLYDVRIYRRGTNETIRVRRNLVKRDAESEAHEARFIGYGAEMIEAT